MLVVFFKSLQSLKAKHEFGTNSFSIPTAAAFLSTFVLPTKASTNILSLRGRYHLFTVNRRYGFRYVGISARIRVYLLKYRMIEMLQTVT